MLPELPETVPRRLTKHPEEMRRGSRGGHPHRTREFRVVIHLVDDGLVDVTPANGILLSRHLSQALGLDFLVGLGLHHTDVTVEIGFDQLIEIQRNNLLQIVRVCLWLFRHHFLVTRLRLRFQLDLIRRLGVKRHTNPPFHFPNVGTFWPLVILQVTGNNHAVVQNLAEHPALGSRRKCGTRNIPVLQFDVRIQCRFRVGIRLHYHPDQVRQIVPVRNKFIAKIVHRFWMRHFTLIIIDRVIKTAPHQFSPDPVHHVACKVSVLRPGHMICKLTA